MREIKFRVWHEMLRDMFTVAHLHFGIDGLRKIETSSISSDSWQLSDIVLMQYTGLRDKHGKEIYEGDILRVDEDSFGVVKWGVGCFYFEDNIDGRTALEDTYVDRFSVIIGNIYEHPELLEQHAVS